MEWILTEVLVSSDASTVLVNSGTVFAPQFLRLEIKKNCIYIIFAIEPVIEKINDILSVYGLSPGNGLAINKMSGIPLSKCGLVEPAGPDIPIVFFSEQIYWV